MKENQQLRCIALKLGVSGTATPIAQTRLYKDSYGFVKLQVYAPITQNTQSPVCTAFCTTTDESGKVKISTGNYNLLYVGEFDLDGKGYSLFESYMPKEFTKVATAPDGLKITFNYYDTEAVVDEHGEVVLDSDGMPKRRATDLLVSSTYTTTVYQGGWNNEGVELNLSTSEASQIVENMRNISAVQLDVLDIQDGMQTLANDLASEVERASGVEATLDEAIGNVSKNVDELKASVEQTSETIEQTRKDAEEMLGQVQNELEKTSQVVNDASAIVDDAKTAVENISQDIREYKNQIDDTVADLENQIIQGGGGSEILVDGKLQAQVKFNSAPQEQLDLKVDTFGRGDIEVVLPKLKALLRAYADSFIGTEDEVTDEEFEELWQQVTQDPDTDIFESYAQFQQALFFPNTWGGAGYLNKVKSEITNGKIYVKTVAFRDKETDDISMFQVCTSDEVSGQLDFALINSADNSELTGHIKVINDNALGYSDASYGWTVGNSTIKLPRKGLYLVEFTTDIDATGFGLVMQNCSIGTYYGQGYAGGAAEVYTSFITRAYNKDSSGQNNYFYAKVFPYRDTSTNTLKLHVELPDNSISVEIEPSYVKYYQII